MGSRIRQSGAQASVQQSRASVTNTRELLQQSAAQLEQARNNYNRSVKLLKDKVISTQEFEQTEATYKGAKATYEASKAQIAGGQFGVQRASANLQQAQANLQKTTITAPTSGVIAAAERKGGRARSRYGPNGGHRDAHHSQSGADGSAGRRERNRDCPRESGRYHPH